MSEGGEPSAPATPGLIPLSYTTPWDAASLRLEGFDLPLLLGAELLELLLFDHRQHRLGIGIKCLRHARPMAEVGAACRQRLTCSGNRPRSRQ